MDWEVVTIYGNRDKRKEKQKSQDASAQHVRKTEQMDMPANDKLKANVKQALIQGRIAKKYNQNDLARLLGSKGFGIKDVQLYENGKRFLEPKRHNKYLESCDRILGCKLRGI